jgi:Sulfotransferase domain
MAEDEQGKSFSRAPTRQRGDPNPSRQEGCRLAVKGSELVVDLANLGRTLLRVKAARRVTVFPDDVFLVSYPRSGNTWIRFLVASLLSPENPPTFSTLGRIVPEVYAHTDWELKRYPRPRVIKSHEYFDPRYPKLVYIVRDPRDVALSSYHFLQRRGEIPEAYPIDRFVSRWCTGELWWGQSWGDNVGSWLGSRLNSPDFLLVRYEDLKASPESELGRIATFLGIAAGRQQIVQAVQLGSVDRMRELEHKEPKARPFGVTARPEIPFVRSASVGTWKSALPEIAVKIIEERWGPLMSWLGYELRVVCLEQVTDKLDKFISLLNGRSSRTRSS